MSTKKKSNPVSDSLLIAALEPTYNGGELDEATVVVDRKTGKQIVARTVDNKLVDKTEQRKKQIIDNMHRGMTASSLFGMQVAKVAGSFANPLIGLGIGTLEVGADIYNKDYKSAAFGAALMAMPYIVNTGAQQSLKNAGVSSFNYIDHGFIPESRIFSITGRPNTLRRLMGVGDSGYKDALTQGIIRGKTGNSVLFTAKELKKLARSLSNRGVDDETIRALASGELNEEQWRNVRNALSNDLPNNTTKGIRIEKQTPGERLGNTYEEYKKIQGQQDYIQKMTNLHHEWNSRQDWPANWNGHTMATFALEGEVLDNKYLFPGDYGVEIANADKWARGASDFGHFSIHPVTYKPVPYNHPDVTWFKRAKGLITGKRFLKQVPKSQVEKDRLEYLNSSEK